ncbi:MAG TPA: carboxypeptidase-like regulatory domain-containing protein, partial [Bryobacterales bacterium]|nr:carboxypeptidase-like regulatory domain-containing protein [Bryobacterales bacterium]
MAIVVVGTAVAQVDTGSISGVVTDPSGAVVPAAPVVITNQATNISQQLETNASGFYSAPALKPGVYTIAARHPGLRAEMRTGVELRVQDRLEINFQLQIAAATQEVTVAAAAPLLESQSSSLGQVVGARTITGLPLNGRNFIQLALLTAGVLPSNRAAERDTFVANGARPIQNSYLLDGIENKNHIVGFDDSAAQVVQPVIDAIQEFKVQTSTFSAEFGQAAGGVVNVTIKSGSNDFHGSLFEFFRNSALDATPYFQPPGGGKPRFGQNQYGATLGGPIRRDRTFFFGAWQGTREQSADPRLATVASLAHRQGLFGSTPVFDPATTRPNPSGSGFIRDRFANNQVPASRFDPVSAKLNALYPDPNLPGNANNFFSNQTERIRNDQSNFRVDEKLSDRDSMFARFSFSQDL